MAILRVKDENGNIIEIPAVKGDTGPPGPQGERGPAGENGTATDEQVNTAVSAWLDEHPEATSAVADGSITKAKLAEDVTDAINQGMSPAEKNWIITLFKSAVFTSPDTSIALGELEHSWSKPIDLITAYSSSRTFYVGADSSTTAVGSHGNGNTIPQYVSKRQAECDSAITVTFTNTSNTSVTLINGFIGGILGNDNALTGSGYAGYNAYYTINVFPSGITIESGESITKDYTLPAGYYLFVYTGNSNITVTATGIMDIAEIVNDVPITGTYSLSNGGVVNSTDVFTEDTTIMARMYNPTDTTYVAYNISAGIMLDGNHSYNDYVSASINHGNVKLEPGVVSLKFGRITVPAGYRFITGCKPEYLYIEKIS